MAKKILQNMPPETIQLIAQFAETYSFNKELLLAAVTSFGPLPIQGVKQLLHGFILLGNYRIPVVEVRLSDEKSQLSRAANHLGKALEAFGLSTDTIADDALWDHLQNAPTSERLCICGGLRRPKRVSDNNLIVPDAARLRLVSSAFKRLRECHTGQPEQLFDESANSISTQFISLMELWRLTKQTIDGIPCAEGHGGSRRKPAREGALIRQLINIYGELRNLFPKSGPKPAGGGPMFRFIKACALVCGFSNISDKQIEDAWRQRSKPVNPDNQREK